MCLLIFSLGLRSSVAYFLNEANDFGEYTNSAFSISGTILCGATMVTMIWMMPNLFEFFASVEVIVSKSE